MNYIIDTYGWIEYIDGSKRGEIVKKILEDNKNKIITLECCIAEVRIFCLKKNIDFDRVLHLIKTNSYIFPILLDTWLNAAKIKVELRKNRPGFGIIDAILVAKQQENKAKIISGDPSFKGLKNIVYIGD